GRRSREEENDASEEGEESCERESGGDGRGEAEEEDFAREVASSRPSRRAVARPRVARSRRQGSWPVCWKQASLAKSPPSPREQLLLVGCAGGRFSLSVVFGSAQAAATVRAGRCAVAVRGAR